MEIDIDFALPLTSNRPFLRYGAELVVLDGRRLGALKTFHQLLDVLASPQGIITFNAASYAPVRRRDEAVLAALAARHLKGVLHEGALTDQCDIVLCVDLSPLAKHSKLPYDYSAGNFLYALPDAAKAVASSRAKNEW